MDVFFFLIKLKLFHVYYTAGIWRKPVNNQWMWIQLLVGPNDTYSFTNAIAMCACKTVTSHNIHCSSHDLTHYFFICIVSFSKCKVFHFIDWPLIEICHLEYSKKWLWLIQARFLVCWNTLATMLQWPSLTWLLKQTVMGGRSNLSIFLLSAAPCPTAQFCYNCIDSSMAILCHWLFP